MKARTLRIPHAETDEAIWANLSLLNWRKYRWNESKRFNAQRMQRGDFPFRITILLKRVITIPEGAQFCSQSGGSPESTFDLVLSKISRH